MDPNSIPKWRIDTDAVYCDGAWATWLEKEKEGGDKDEGPLYYVNASACAAAGVN